MPLARSRTQPFDAETVWRVRGETFGVAAFVDGVQGQPFVEGSLFLKLATQ